MILLNLLVVIVYVALIIAGIISTIIILGSGIIGVLKKMDKDKRDKMFLGIAIGLTVMWILSDLGF